MRIRAPVRRYGCRKDKSQHAYRSAIFFGLIQQVHTTRIQAASTWLSLGNPQMGTNHPIRLNSTRKGGLYPAPLLSCQMVLKRPRAPMLVYMECQYSACWNPKKKGNPLNQKKAYIPKADRRSFPTGIDMLLVKSEVEVRTYQEPLAGRHTAISALPSPL